MGDAEGLPDRLDPADEADFPGLVQDGYRVTSPKDNGHNCIAYAAGDQSHWWDCPPMPLPGYFWPKGARRGYSPDDLRSCFEAIGFEVCGDGTVEPGFEKVALYVGPDGEWSHAARLQDDGAWISKLGANHDVRHESVDCFTGSIYGQVSHFMRRRKDQRTF